MTILEKWKLKAKYILDDLNIGTKSKRSQCDSSIYLNMLNKYEIGIRAQVVNEPEKNREAYEQFTHAQITSLIASERDFTEKKKHLEEFNAELGREIIRLEKDIETKTELIQQHNREIAELKQTITQQTIFNCLKKTEKGIMGGWYKKVLTIIDEGKSRKIQWDGTHKASKNLLLDSATEININEMHLVITGKNETGKHTTLHLKADPENSNDLFNLYLSVSAAITHQHTLATGADEGGKKLSHYKKTKKRKFNSLSNKSKTKKRKKSKKRKLNKK